MPERTAKNDGGSALMTERASKLYATVDETSPRGLPKYLRVCRMIEDEIAAGRIRSGDRLPSELQLTQVLPTSLGTVQKALGALAERGIVVRLQGKGTFIADQRVDENKLWHLRFLKDDGTLAPVYVNFDSIRSIKHYGPWTDVLGSHASFIEVRRTMNIDHEFTLASNFYVAGPQFWELLTIPADELDATSLRGTLGEKRFDVATLRAVEYFGCQPVPAEMSDIIGVAEGSIAMLCDVAGYGVNDDPVYYQRYWIPPNQYRLEAGARIP